MKIATGIGVTTLCAMLAAVPVFGYANAAELDVSGSTAVAESSTENTDAAEALKGITEEEATELLGETSSEEDQAQILIDEGTAWTITTKTVDADGNEKTETTSIEDVEFISADGVNGSFVSEYQDILPVEWSEEFCAEVYNVKADRYQDENLSKLAAEYLDQGYFLSDLKRDGELLGAGIGYGGYYFNTGFCAVDDIMGNNSFITYVAKISQDDFIEFVKDNGACWTQKSATEYTCNDGVNDIKVTFDPATGILIYTNDLPEDGKG